jgi:DnaK suppressor protein
VDDTVGRIRSAGHARLPVVGSMRAPDRPVPALAGGAPARRRWWVGATTEMGNAMTCFERHTMSIDHRTVDHSWLADLRATLADDFATQTARLRELSELNADTGDPGEAHNRAELLVTTRRAIEQITGALRRIADGTYGTCQNCDRNIPVERLEVLPHARFCVPCQEKANG